MLKFIKVSVISIAALLTFPSSTFANTVLNDKSTTNLVELFKVKVHATEYINNLEEKIRATEPEEQEELLVEFAQVLLYYQERHNSGSHESSTNTKGLNSKNIIFNKALNAYKKASALALDKNRIKYTRELSELTVNLGKKTELVRIFDNLLQHTGDEKGTYLAHVDYADGLAKFKDSTAETQFLLAINLRTSGDGVEANFRYANYLLDKNKLLEALSILDKFTFEERRMYVHIAILRQKIIHQLKIDTKEVDVEIEELRKNLGNSPFIGAIPKFISKAKNVSTNSLGLPSVNAFAHNNESDDSRGGSRSAGTVLYEPQDKLIYLSDSFILSALYVNAAEVVYNEARGDKLKGRYAIAWAIRNRATINMNGCDSYPGAEGHATVSACRMNTPDGLGFTYGPIYSNSDLFKRYSCVVHGGTISVGASHNQMNDAHVDIDNLASSGILWEVLYVINGWLPDPTGPRIFLSDGYPDNDFFTGNPDGAQEWRSQKYCANNQSCKVRLGNVGGDLFDVGSSCMVTGGHNTDKYFWGRKSHVNASNVITE